MSIRYRLYDDPKYPHTELVGVVQSVAEPEDGRVTFLDKHGRSHVVPSTAVIAAKVFPL